MGYFPFNPHLGQELQTDVDHILNKRAFVAHYTAAAAGAVTSDDDYFFAAADMQNGAYTLLHTSMPGAVARNIIATAATQGGVADTMGTVVIVGTDIAGEALTETITPANGVVAGTKAFLTVASITGADWARDGAAGSEDHIKFGFGDLIGLPDKLHHGNTVLAAALNHVREATAPTVTTSATVLASNTVDLNSALDGHDVDIWYLVEE